MNFEFYTKGLTKKDGIWYANKKSPISYPDDGNDVCFQIEDDSFWFKHRNNCIVQLVKKYAPTGLFFDIGGGNGVVSKAIENAGIQSVLVEPGERGCINAQKRNLSNIICSTLENAGFEKNSVPVIGVFDVVEHFEHDIDFLNNIHSYLVKGGLVFVTVPAYSFLWSTEDDEAGHHNRYTINSLVKKLNTVGFDIEYSTCIFSILPIPVFLFRTIPGKMGFKKNKASGTEQAKNDHKKESPFLNKIWQWELNRIKQSKTIPFGGSCLVVARKR